MEDRVKDTQVKFDRQKTVNYKFLLVIKEWKCADTLGYVPFRNVNFLRGPQKGGPFISVSSSPYLSISVSLWGRFICVALQTEISNRCPLKGP